MYFAARQWDTAARESRVTWTTVRTPDDYKGHQISFLTLHRPRLTIIPIRICFRRKTIVLC